MKIRRLPREYPHINGFPVSPAELELPATVLDPLDQESYNNHHHCWTKTRMAELAITQLWRDLARNQTVLPKDVHTGIHRHYEPIRQLPSLLDLMDEIDEAYRRHELLRFGSAQHPAYGLITETTYRDIQQEYNQLHS